jgi:nickel superoxide dismutase
VNKILGLLGLLLFAVVGLGVREAAAHCQVPCGIYDDAARIHELEEDASTITKAINKIRELSGKHDSQAFNQAVRWVTTKDAHASHIITTVAEYFLAQKVKTVGAGEELHNAYLASLADHHAVIKAAMKTKQRADLEAAKALDQAIAKLATHY